MTTPTVEEPVARLLAQMTAEAPNLQSIVIGFVRKDGNAAVRYTPMSTAMLAHLSRIFDLKIDREYMGSMFPPARPTVRAPSTNTPVRQAVQSAAAAAKASPAERLAERERTKNKAKAATKKKGVR